MMRKLRQVALLVDASRESGRGILRGILRYNQQHEPWSIYYQPQGIDDLPPAWLLDWKGDGILARINDRRSANLLLKTGLPVIDLRAVTVVPQFPRLEVDNQIMADMVVSYLLDRGIRRFAFCGYARGVHRLYDERCDAFAECVQRGGFPCEIFHLISKRNRSLSWETEQLQIARWIKTLHHQIGIMACNDDLGLKVLDACRRIGRRVPDEVAVVGVENDPFLCNLCKPPLTSVDVNPERLGYEACILLERLMQRGKVPNCTRCAPAGIVERQSTDVLAIDDPEIVRAIRYIRDHACMGMAVSDLTAQIPLSRSSLNRRFHDVLGRSPKEEIARVQMTRACELLVNTDMPIHTVAKSCGFADSNYFSKWFHGQHGTSPRRFRLRTAK